MALSDVFTCMFSAIHEDLQSRPKAIPGHTWSTPCKGNGTITVGFPTTPVGTAVELEVLVEFEPAGGGKKSEIAEIRIEHTGRCQFRVGGMEATYQGHYWTVSRVKDWDSLLPLLPFTNSLKGCMNWYLGALDSLHDACNACNACNAQTV